MDLKNPKNNKPDSDNIDKIQNFGGEIGMKDQLQNPKDADNLAYENSPENDYYGNDNYYQDDGGNGDVGQFEPDLQNWGNETAWNNGDGGQHADGQYYDYQNDYMNSGDLGG